MSKKENVNLRQEFDLVKKPKDKSAELIKMRKLAYSQQLRQKSVNRTSFKPTFNLAESLREIDILYEMMIKSQKEWLASFKLAFFDKIKSIDNLPVFGNPEARALKLKGKFWCLWIQFKRKDMNKETLNGLIMQSLKEVKEEKEMNRIYSIFESDLKGEEEQDNTSASKMLEESKNFKLFYEKKIKPLEEQVKRNRNRKDNESMYSVEREFMLSPRKAAFEIERHEETLLCVKEKGEFSCQTDDIWNNLDFQSIEQVCLLGKKRAVPEIQSQSTISFEGHKMPFRGLKAESFDSINTLAPKRELTAEQSAFFEAQGKVKQFLTGISNNGFEIKRKEKPCLERENCCQYSVEPEIQPVEESFIEEPLPLDEDIQSLPVEQNILPHSQTGFDDLMMERDLSVDIFQNKKSTQKVFYMSIFEDRYAFVKEGEDVKVFEKRRRR